MKRPAFILALIVLAGAVAGRIAQWMPVIPMIIALIFVISAITLSVFQRNKHHGNSPLTIRFLLFALFFAAMFQQSVAIHRENRADSLVQILEKSAESIAIRGTLVSEPSRRNGQRTTMILRDVWVESHNVQGLPAAPFFLPCKVQITLLGNLHQKINNGNMPYPGDSIQVAGRLRAPASAIHSDLFDYRAFLKNRGIQAQINVKHTLRFQAKTAERGTWSQIKSAWLFGWRRQVLQATDQVLPTEHAAILRAMLFGDTGLLTPNMREVFIRIGAAHLFAVSGLHTTLLALMIFGLCQLLGMRPRLSAAVMITTLLTYMVLVGFRPSVVRATLMATCLALPLLVPRMVDTLNALSVSALITMLLDPVVIFRVDFQFSYLCVFGLITLLPAAREMLRVTRHDLPPKERVWWYSIWRWTGAGLAVVLIAQMVTLPLLSVYFHRFSNVAVISNLVLVPFASLVLCLGWLFALIATTIPALADLIGIILSASIGLFLAIAKFFAALPAASFPILSFPWWLSGLYYLILFSGTPIRLHRSPGAIQIRRTHFTLRLALTITLLAWWPVLTNARIFGSGAQPQLLVTMLDVGQGDCTILQLPDKRILVIDTGRDFNIKIIQDYLYTLGTDEIDALILTHSDADHIGAAAELIERFYIDKIFVGPDREDSPEQKALDRAIYNQGVPVLHASRGDRITNTPDVRLEFLHPATENAIPPKASANEKSLVLLAELGKMTFLFMADTGKESEQRILQTLGAQYIQAEILKIGHHGSRFSSSQIFLQAVAPQIALISAGRHNPYGHPTQEVLDKLKAISCDTYITAQSGTVELRTDGQKLWIRPTRNRK